MQGTANLPSVRRVEAGARQRRRRTL